jgi:UDP-glucose 4-epimerase
MKILITGGAGFIGSHLCDKYVSEGHTVICLDNFMSGDLTNVRHLLSHRNFKLINGDVRDFDLVEKSVTGVDSIFHLAAQIHVDKSIVEPKMTYDINVGGTLNVLEAARMHDVGRVLFASSSEVYGSAEFNLPMNEDHPLNAPHPYGASKIAGDRMCYSYIKTYGMDICIVRSFNVYGPRQKDSGYGGAISIFARRVMQGLPPVIYGDGNQTRDYLYIPDLIAGYDSLFHHEGRVPDPINFGTGEHTKIVDIANKIIHLFGKNLVPVYIDPRPGEVYHLIADIERAQVVLGWKPKCDIESGLARFADWYRNYRAEVGVKPG